ncbi:cation diffusion facilitator family transporter [Krasilnikovia sp. M28-CT-15]|uniref:cation diffusion facilitator family transporter n=1 Tax=Krasilnikovia sp. M28-CT-15 TaxID=3373540 RepID=UPI00387625EE
MSAATHTVPNLRRYAWLSIAAAVLTIALKFVAYLVTGSVGLLSDAAESVVNLVAAIIALVALTVAARPADASHHYGHGKAEYFSAGLEGLMIFVAAGVILVSAVRRFIYPVALESLGLGVAISAVATGLNAVVGLLLIRVGRRERSVTLTADGKHLMTDVWTSAGVIAGVVLVGVTGWQRLDPVVAVIVGVNILVTGGLLVAQSVRALLDQSLGPVELAAIVAALDRFRSAEVGFHGLQTRQSGRHRFVSVHVLVPGAWTVQAGHDLLEQIEQAIRDGLADTTVLTHMEPREDPRAYDDYAFEGHPDPPARPDESRDGR